MQAHPYIFFEGNCREAFEFYQKLGIGTVVDMMTNDQVPPGQEYDPKRAKNIMHGSMRIGEQLIMASDSPPDWYEKPQGFNIHITAPTAAEADRLFAALSEGGKVQMPMAETFWALRFGACVDRFGIPWMVSADRPAT